jgi:hypothetical protein
MRRQVTAATALTAIALLAIAPAAPATYDPIGSGATKLALDKRFVSFLKADGIELSASAGAKRKGAVITLPVTAGNVDPTVGQGEIDNEGTITFQSERKRIPWRNLVVKTKHSPLIAKVGGSQLKLATSSQLSSKREGFGTAFAAKSLKLTAKVATRLNKKLRPKVPFSQGQLLGTLSSNAQPALVTILEQGKATISLDPAFVAKMDAHFVSINPIFPAEHLVAGFTFPIIVGSQIAPDASQGTLRTGGALEFLQLHAGQVFWHEPWLDLGARSDSAEVDVEPTPTFPGKLGRVGILDLGAAAVASEPKARTISVSGASLTLQAQAAKTLDEAFASGKEDFKAGETVGAVSFVAQGQ